MSMKKSQDVVKNQHFPTNKLLINTMSINAIRMEMVVDVMLGLLIDWDNSLPALPSD